MKKLLQINENLSTLILKMDRKGQLFSYLIMYCIFNCVNVGYS